MSALDPQTRREIEEALGRPLVDDEVVPVGGFGELTAAEREVARTLADRQSALCGAYLQAIATASEGATQRFVEALRSPRVHPVPAVDLTLRELHRLLTSEGDAKLPPVGVAIKLLRAGLTSADDESATLALEAMNALRNSERDSWGSGGTTPPFYMKVQKALREEWRRAAEAARESSALELREAALESLQLLA